MNKLLLAIGIMTLGFLTVAFGGVVPSILIIGFIALALWSSRN